MVQDLNRKGLVDVHCHVLPGIDDGPADAAESVKMARILADAGFSEVWCTPHLIKGLYEAPSAVVREAVECLRREIDAAGIPLTLSVGREYHLDEFLPSFLADPLPIGGKYLLVEPPFRGNPQIIPDAIYPAIKKGFTPLIAHPERCSTLDPGDAVVQRLREMGCVFQLNIGSFAGIYGEAVRRRAESFLASENTGIAATDAHSALETGNWLPRGLAALAKAGGAVVGFPTVG